jgi:hypothetical protein
MNDDITLSALVVLRPRRLESARGGIGRRPETGHLLARETLQAVTGFFAQRGFAIGNVVSTSFWIKSRPRHFEDLFGQAVQIESRRNRVESIRLRDGSTEFNLASLPEDIARHLLAVVFTEPLISRWMSEEPPTADVGAWR